MSLLHHLRRPRQLVAKIRARLAEGLRQRVPHNTRYRPTGVHVSSQQLAAAQPAITYHGVVPAYVSKVDIPPSFYAKASDYGGLHGKPHAEEAVPEAFVLELPQGRVYADNAESVAVIGPDNCLVGDASFQYSNKRWTTLPAAENNIFRQRWFEPPFVVDGTVCNLLSGGGARSGNYYHWLVDSLPLLHLVQKAGLLAEVDYFLVYNKHLSFVRETLGALGIGPERLLDAATHPHVQAKRLLATSSVRASGSHTPQWATDFLRNSYPPDPALMARFGPRVYITRRDAPGRVLTNEAEVERLLAARGFETYALSELSLPEKIALFARARVIVSPVGAGLCNTAFCRPGAVLFELLAEDFVVFDYLEFSARVGMHHRFLVCPAPAAAPDRKAAQYQDLVVPMPEFERIVSEILPPETAAGVPVSAAESVGTYR